ncbi:hypothetical protein QJS66_03255 [Kocuria rhizophila]|nr:hypothetical protein QJS66_03255 [Kocuria rhizophila]
MNFAVARSDSVRGIRRHGRGGGVRPGGRRGGGCAGRLRCEHEGRRDREQGAVRRAAAPAPNGDAAASAPCFAVRDAPDVGR